MGYVCPSTRALRASVRYRPSARLPEKKPFKPSPAAFWFWFDDVLRRDERDQLNYCVHMQDGQVVYQRLWQDTKPRTLEAMKQAGMVSQ